MKCTFCGYLFQEYHGLQSCAGCPLRGSCGKTKCPNCGFELPKDVGLVKIFKRWRRKPHGNYQTDGLSTGNE